MEIRNIKFSNTETKDRKFVGYAAMFDSISEDLGGFREIIKPGAFTKSLESGRDILALAHHDHKQVLGRTKAGTLELSQDNLGLRVVINPPDTSYANDLMASVNRGDIDGMSFGFKVKPIDVIWQKNVRYINNLELIEVSLVSMPAYGATTVSAREQELCKILTRSADQVINETDEQSIRDMIKYLTGLLPKPELDKRNELLKSLRNL